MVEHNNNEANCLECGDHTMLDKASSAPVESASEPQLEKSLCERRNFSNPPLLKPLSANGTAAPVSTNGTVPALNRRTRCMTETHDLAGMEEEQTVEVEARTVNRRIRAAAAPRRSEAHVSTTIRALADRQRSVADSMPVAQASGGRVTPELVASQTDRIVESFMISAYYRDKAHDSPPHSYEDRDEADSPPDLSSSSSASHYSRLVRPPTPEIPELTLPNVHPMSQEAIIGARLARIGDEIAAKYGAEFDKMAEDLMTSVTARTFDQVYAVLTQVGQRIFHSGISWGRIAAFLSFGYRTVVSMFQHGVRHFLAAVVKFITGYFARRHISEWIASVGGWSSVMTYDLSQESGAWGWPRWLTFALVTSGLILAAAYFLRRSK